MGAVSEFLNDYRIKAMRLNDLLTQTTACTHGLKKVQWLNHGLRFLPALFLVVIIVFI
ncbi:MAG: hypothetical protein IJS04_03265 [Muribaculaceae bacterium]|nr:hypothetical protein [Muribaculaceae bacterium]